MSTTRGEVPGPFGPVLGDIRAQISSGKTNEILSYHVRMLLDRLSPDGWLAAGLFIADCITCGDFHHLCDYDPDVLDLGASDQSILRQCLAFFGKRKDIDIGVDRQDAARVKFAEAERACALTNACFRAWSQGRFQFRPEVESILHASQLKISELLGLAPSLSEIRPRFGPGATTQTPKKNACVPVKVSSTPACSTNVPDSFLDEISASLPHYWDELDEGQLVVDYELHRAKLEFVPKNAKIDRAICTEPALNGMYQLGLGDLMARRLRRVGLDIRDQSANQRAACYGSISGASATLDLSSASDTISRGLVSHLLPMGWVELLEGFRSAEYRDRKSGVHTFHKISSMGNGFTFPLETIVFWALAESCKDACCRSSRIRTLVYGDDIIVDVRAFDMLVRVLCDLGFTPNAKKSFATGVFRESCGSDFVYGTNIRPCYVTEPLTALDAIRLHNFFWRRGDLSSALFYRSLLGPEVALHGPDGYGDGHLVTDQWSSPLRRKLLEKGYNGSSFETWTTRPKALKAELARKYGSPVKVPVKTWDPNGKSYKVEEKSVWVFHPRAFNIVRRIATYIALAREDRGLTLTQSDKLRSSGRHVYADRRMPNPTEPRNDGDIFVVPGEGKVCRVRVYTLEPLQMV